MKSVFEIKEGDLKVEPNPNPPAPEPTVNVETEFTVVERQIMYFYIEYTFHIITFEEYQTQITHLGYSEE